MLILISGPNGSGKSAFAEKTICSIPGRRVYAATMICQTQENALQIQKHRNQRADMDFLTVEEPYSLARIPASGGDVVLLEDVSNLLANVIFDRGGRMEDVLEDILSLAGRCRALAAVTISGLRAEGYSGQTADYIRALEELNRRLLDRSDAAFELCGGKAVRRKGALSDVV